MWYNGKTYRIEIRYEENTYIYKKRNRPDGKPCARHPLHVPRPSGQKIHLLHRLAFHHTPVLPDGCYGWIQGNRSVPHDRKCTACTRSYNKTIISCTGVASICIQHVYHKRCLTDYLCAICDHCAFHVGEGTSDHSCRCDADNRCEPRKYAYADGESTELVSICEIWHVPRYIRGNYAPYTIASLLGILISMFFIKQHAIVIDRNDNAVKLPKSRLSFTASHSCCACWMSPNFWTSASCLRSFLYCSCLYREKLCFTWTTHCSAHLSDFSYSSEIWSACQLSNPSLKASLPDRKHTLQSVPARLSATCQLPFCCRDLQRIARHLSSAPTSADLARSSLRWQAWSLINKLPGNIRAKRGNIFCGLRLSMWCFWLVDGIVCDSLDGYFY
mgnify:CR=1 FL=1